ncbi:MAG: ABC transporter permease [Chloroflexi bacterium]|nr:ABC transporter permease [Chloroflexota bacterium]
MASPTLAPPPPPASWRRRLQAALYGHRAAQLLLLLLPPAGWFGVVYLGSLAILFVAAFWYLDPLTSAVRHDLTLRNFEQILAVPVYRTIVLRTVGVATLVTLLDVVLAFPVAYLMARVAAPRTRALLFAAVLLPLWTSYLVRVFAWRTIISKGGPVDWLLAQVGLPGASLYNTEIAMVIVFTYLWLPYMILPIYAGLERIPASLLEASADLGARHAATFRRVVLPLALPAVAAGSIFTFSLTLGDYITPQLISNSQFIGNVVYDSQGVAGNVPFAAAFATVPVLIMGIYLLGMRRLGAFEAL